LSKIASNLVRFWSPIFCINHISQDERPLATGWWWRVQQQA